MLLFDGATTSIAKNRMRVVEPEFAFRFAVDVPPRATAYTLDEVLRAVGGLHLALELPDSRFADFTKVGGATLIADLACGDQLVVGPEVKVDWRAIDLSRHKVKAHVRNKLERDGSGENVLGDPCIALTWIVNELSSLGIPLRQGELVTTGTCMAPLAIVEGDHVTADFGVLGAIGVSTAAARG